MHESGDFCRESLLSVTFRDIPADQLFLFGRIKVRMGGSVESTESARSGTFGTFPRSDFDSLGISPGFLDSCISPCFSGFLPVSRDFSLFLGISWIPGISVLSFGRI